jgi:hypothetical protein
VTNCAAPLGIDCAKAVIANKVINPRLIDSLFSIFRDGLVGELRGMVYLRDMEDKLVTDQTEHPIRTKVESEEFYKGIDAGIRFAVRVLHAHGIETCQSCQGGEGHCYDRPTIDMIAIADDVTGFAALHYLQSYGLEVKNLAILWRIRNGLPYEKLWRIVFRETMESRADEQPMFTMGYQATATKSNSIAVFDIYMNRHLKIESSAAVDVLQRYRGLFKLFYEAGLESTSQLGSSRQD